MTDHPPRLFTVGDIVTIRKECEHWTHSGYRPRTVGQTGVVSHIYPRAEEGHIYSVLFDEPIPDGEGHRLVSTGFTTEELEGQS